MDQERGYAEKFREQVESCYSCGQCEFYCPFFPRAFSLLEEEEQYGREGLLGDAYEGLLELCYDCKLCKIACPFKYDLPHIVIRAKAGVMRNGEYSWIKTIFQKVDRVEFILGWFAPLLNPLLRIRSFRNILQRMTGIHKDRLLPSFYFLTFRMQVFLQALSGRLPKKKKRTGSKESLHKVVYFYGCYTNHHRPQEGMAVLKVLQACGIEVVIPAHQCCGLPQVSEGFLGDARKNMACNLAVWKKYVAAGYDIIVTTTPCSLTIKQEYPVWMGADADFLKGHVFEATEYLLRLYEKGEIQPPMIPLNLRVAYHVSCHLKAQNMGMPSLKLLQLIPGLKIEVIDRGCCGLAGCMGYTEDTFDLSMEIGAPMIKGIRECLPDLAVSDCPKCNLQIQQGTGLDAMHPIELLAKAMKGSGLESDAVHCIKIQDLTPLC